MKRVAVLVALLAFAGCGGSSPSAEQRAYCSSAVVGETDAAWADAFLGEPSSVEPDGAFLVNDYGGDVRLVFAPDGYLYAKTC